MSLYRGLYFSLSALVLADVVKNAQEEKEGQLKSKTVNVLIADDETTIRNLFSITLKMAGHNVVQTFPNGKELLDYIVRSAKPQQDGEREEKVAWPDIILLDWIMPVLDGAQTARILKTTFPKIKILMIAASDLPVDIKNIADGYLKKPVSRNSLVREVSKIILES